MARIPYHQLDLFLTIAREGSIRGAARSLGMTAPSVSQGLKQLESQLGLPLFTRTTRRIDLTDAGRTLFEQASPAMSQLDQALESVIDLGGDPSGKLKITLPRFVYQLFFQPLYAEFCRRYPGIELEVSLDDTSVDLIADGYDLGIRFGDRISDTMVARRLTPDMAIPIVASPDYLAAHGTPESPGDLKGHRQIRYRFSGSRRFAPMVVNQAGQSVEIEMSPALIVNDTDMLLDAAVRGLGVAIIAQPSVQPALDNGTLLPLLESWWGSLPGLHLYYAQGSQKAKRVRVLIDFLLANQVTHW